MGLGHTGRGSDQVGEGRWRVQYANVGMLERTRQAIVAGMGDRNFVTRKMRTLVVTRGFMNQRVAISIRAVIVPDVSG